MSVQRSSNYVTGRVATRLRNGRNDVATGGGVVVGVTGEGGNGGVKSHNQLTGIYHQDDYIDDNEQGVHLTGALAKLVATITRQRMAEWDKTPIGSRNIGVTDSDLGFVIATLDDYISKTKDDQAEGLIKFLKGAHFGKFDSTKGAYIDSEGNVLAESVNARKLIKSAEYLIGNYLESGGLGGRFWADKSGESNGELHNLRLNKSLTVPQIIFDTIKAVGGKFWFTDTHTITTVVKSGQTYICDLDLKEGEYCTWDKDDCLTGIMHTQDAQGNFNGFATVECLVLSVSNNKATIAPRVDALPPVEGLTLNRCGNVTNVRRQSSVFLSAEFGGIITLVNMNSWTIGKHNIGAANGDLSKLANIISMPEVSGMSSLQRNVLAYGKFFQIDDITGGYVPIPRFLGDWSNTVQYSYYDEVTHLGRRFLCIQENGLVGIEPYRGSANWLCTVDSGQDGDKWNYCGLWKPDQIYQRNDVVLYGRDTYMYQLHEPSQGYYPDAQEYFQISLKGEPVRIVNTQSAYESLNVKSQQDRVWALMSKGGLDGDAAFNKQYSPDKVIIHNEYIEGDVWSRDRVNNGDWSIWYKIKGESANEPNFLFKYSLNKPTLISGTASIKEMIADGWSDVPPVVKPDGYKLWQVYGKINEYGNIIASWSEPYSPDGDNGKDGISIKVQYASTQHSTDWHYPFRAGDEWERQSTDGGKTWTDPWRCVGEKGDQGDLSPYTENQYYLHDSYTTPPSQSSALWQDEPFADIAAGLYVWRRERRVVPPAQPGSWGAPYPITGTPGDSVNPCGAWDRNREYKRNDVVTDNGSSYIARKNVPRGMPLEDKVYEIVTCNNNEVTVQSKSLRARKDGSEYWLRITDKPVDIITWGLQSSVDVISISNLGFATPSAYQVDLIKLVNNDRITPDRMWMASRYYNGKSWDRIGNAVYATSTSVNVRADASMYESRVYASQFDANDWAANYLAKSSVSRVDSGKDGSDGISPIIKDGYWWIGSVNTGIQAQGNNGVTPHIGTNGNWWIGGTDTGIKAQGDKGDAGSTARPCGLYKPGTEYIWDANYRDVVISMINGSYYQFSVRVYGSKVTSAPTIADGDSNWISANKFDFIATQLLLVDKAVIDNLVTRMVATAAEGARIQIMGTMMTVFGNVAKNIEFGVDESGMAVMKYFNNAGKMLYNLGPNGIDWGSILPASWSVVKLVPLVEDPATDALPHWNSISSVILRLSQYLGTSYYKYFAGNNPEINPDEKDKERYLYTHQNTSSAKIADGWYCAGWSGMYPHYWSDESGLYIKPDGERGIYETFNGVLDKSPMYCLEIILYRGGMVADRVNVYWSGYNGIV